MKTKLAILAACATMFGLVGSAALEAREGGHGGGMGGGGGRSFSGGGGGISARSFSAGSVRSFNGGGMSRGISVHRGVGDGVAINRGGNFNRGVAINRGGDFNRGINRGPRHAENWNGGNWKGDWKGGHHRHNRNRFVFFGSPYYYDDYAYGSSGYGCSWLYRQAVRTGSSYWWNRYEDCIG